MIQSIAERQGISYRYLEQLLLNLKKSSVVKSVRGSQGGYILAKEPRDITVGNVICPLEGPISPVDCVGEVPDNCIRAEFCVTRLVWSRIRDSIKGVLDSTTLEDHVEESEKICNQRCTFGD